MVISSEFTYCIIQFLAYFHSASITKNQVLGDRTKSNALAWSFVYIAIPLAIALMIGWLISNGWIFLLAVLIQIPLMGLAIILSQLV